MILKLIDTMEQKLEKLISISSNVLPHVARKALPQPWLTIIRMGRGVDTQKSVGYLAFK